MERIGTKQQAEAAWAEFCRHRAPDGTQRAETSRCVPKRDRPCHLHGSVGCEVVTHRMAVQFNAPARRVIIYGRGSSWQEALDRAKTAMDAELGNVADEAGGP